MKLITRNKIYLEIGDIFAFKSLNFTKFDCIS